MKKWPYVSLEQMVLEKKSFKDLCVFTFLHFFFQTDFMYQYNIFTHNLRPRFFLEWEGGGVEPTTSKNDLHDKRSEVW